MKKFFLVLSLVFFSSLLCPAHSWGDQHASKEKCVNDPDCDDGLFCNGTEFCAANGKCYQKLDIPCESGQECDEAADKCIGKTLKEKCEAKGKKASCYESGTYCSTVVIKDGTYCCECLSMDKGKSCYDFGDDVGSHCSTCDRKDMACISYTPPGYRLQCKKCVKKGEEDKAKCGQRELLPGSCPGTCSKAKEKCSYIPVDGAACHACAPKKTCSDLGYPGDYDACWAVCKDKGKCVRRRTDDFDKPCWECIKEGQAAKCQKKDMFAGLCPGSCKTGENCDNFSVEGENCHRCWPSVNCPVGYVPGLCLDGTCAKGEMCLPIDGPCYQCKERTDDQEDVCAECELFPGSCPGSCKIDEGHYCVDGSVGKAVCHECKIKGIECYDGWKVGLCKEENCQKLYLCVAEGYCYQCRAPKEAKNECEKGDMLPGPCPACNAATEVCMKTYVDEASCHLCIPKRLADQACDEYEMYVGPCPGTCRRQTERCEETMVHGVFCHTCEPKLQQQDSCLERHLRSGPCPGTCKYPSRQMPLATPTPALYPGAGKEEASLDQMCIPRGEDCHLCFDIKKFKATYAAVVIETLLPRFVLNKDFDPVSLKNFSPKSVMALAKVNAQELAEIEKLAALTGGKVTVGTLEDMAGLLAEGLGEKRHYTDDCFSGFTVRNFGKTPPEISGDTGAGSAEYGQDASRQIQVDGPVLACGKTNGENALAVFGADGSLARNISQEELKNNPAAILEALEKAGQAQSIVEYIQKVAPQGLLKQAVSTLVSKIVEPRPSELEQRRKKKNQAVSLETPNDPFFLGPQKAKKKKLLGIFGGSKPEGGLNLGFGEISGGGKKKDVENQWGLSVIGFTPKSDPDSAWNVIDGQEKNVLVAVIDSGLDMTHPDGPEYIWTNENEIPGNGRDDDLNGYVDDVHGWNFIDNSNDLTDRKGHGTFVAGIIAAKTDNQIGIAGINPGAVIMPLKVADEEGEATSLNIYRAVRYAVNHGARVINISLGNRGVSEMEQAAINAAYEQGAFITVASGNVNENISEHGPASAKGIFPVGSLDMNGERSPISNWGANNGLLAPGEDVYSLRSVDSFKKGRYKGSNALYYTQSGTSFASPMVAATASLMLAHNPAFTNEQIEDILTATAVDMYSPGWDDQSGAGLLNASEALRTAPEGLITVRINELRIQKQERKRRIDYVDVFATVRGPFQEFTIGVGRGKKAKRFKKVGGPFKSQAQNDWVMRIDESHLRGGREWTVQISVMDQAGKKETAQAQLMLAE